MKNLLLFFFVIFLSCKENKESLHEEKRIDSKVFVIGKPSKIDYLEFKADSISNVKINGFDIKISYQINGMKIITGNYLPVNGELSPYDSEKDNGLRLLVLDEKEEIIFKSSGQADAFMFQPHFYKNKENNKIIIVCQLAFEYFYGGEVFLIENNLVKHIGNIDIASTSEETSLIDIVKINEIGKQIRFSFISDSLLLEPGSKDLNVKNNDIHYIFEDGTLRFYR